jgi:hypothetical protein
MKLGKDYGKKLNKMTVRDGKLCQEQNNILLYFGQIVDLVIEDILQVFRKYIFLGCITIMWEFKRK